MKKEQDRNPRQSEFNLATVNGEQVFLPHDDLYIPPNALKIFLELRVLKITEINKKRTEKTNAEGNRKIPK